MIERPSLILPGSAIDTGAGGQPEDEIMGGPVRLPGGFALPVQIERVLGFGRSFSFWPLLFGLACCAIEMMATFASRFDLGRFGAEVYRASPRQADLMITAGTLTWKMAPNVKRIYEQMPEPKWVIAMGACAISGGIFRSSYNVVPGYNRIIPVDVYVPGCPPRPEALIYAIQMLHKKINRTPVIPELPKIKLPEIPGF
jgi:NADH-quinone oxidoreductase subunit B